MAHRVNERRLQTQAAFFVAALVAAAWGATAIAERRRSTAPPYDLRAFTVASQRPSRDASRPGWAIEVGLPSGIPPGQALKLTLLDRRDRVLMSEVTSGQEASLVVPPGHAGPIVAPQLRVEPWPWSSFPKGQAQVTLALDSIPAPPARPLPDVSASRTVRCVRGFRGGGDGRRRRFTPSPGLRFFATRPLGERESLECRVLATPNVSFAQPPAATIGRDYTGFVDFPWGADTPRVQVEVTRYRRTSDSVVCTFHHARLEERFGRVAFVTDQAETVLTPEGSRLVLPKQDNGSKRWGRGRDPRIVNIRFQASQRPHAERGWEWPSVELVSPTLQELGLRDIRGVMHRLPSSEAGPVRLGPMTLKVRYHYRYRRVPLSTERLVLPVEDE